MCYVTIISSLVVWFVYEIVYQMNDSKQLLRALIYTRIASHRDAFIHMTGAFILLYRFVCVEAILHTTAMVHVLLNNRKIVGYNMKFVLVRYINVYEFKYWVVAFAVRFPFFQLLVQSMRVENIFTGCICWCFKWLFFFFRFHFILNINQIVICPSV